MKIFEKDFELKPLSLWLEKAKQDFWYSIPDSLEWREWEDWEREIKKIRPIQYFLRNFYKSFWYAICRYVREARYTIKCFFKPYHSDIRKAVPHKWADVSSLVVDVNFAMLLSFKKEADESCVDWDGTENHRKFKNWLDSAAHWITVGRPNCKAQADALYPPYPLPGNMRQWTYDQLYGELNKMEKLINETDSNIIKQMIDYREYMWT